MSDLGTLIGALVVETEALTANIGRSMDRAFDAADPRERALEGLLGELRDQAAALRARLSRLERARLAALDTPLPANFVEADFEDAIRDEVENG